MEPHPKRSRSDINSNSIRVSEQQQWGFFQQSNGGGDLECRRFNTPDGCPFGSTCRFRHVSTDSQDFGPQNMSSGGKPKPCMKFFSTSGCSYGESCHFQHYVPGGLSSLGLSPIVSLSAVSAIISQRKPEVSIGDLNTTVNGYKTKLCNRFNTAEGCRFGDKCHFAHGEDDLRLPNNPSRGNFWKAPVEGTRGMSPPGFSNVDSEFPSPTKFGSMSNFNSQGSGELNPPGVAVSDDSASYSARPIGENLQVY